MKRRQYVTAIATSSILGISGCSGSGDTDTQNTTTSSGITTNNSTATSTPTPAQFDTELILPESAEIGESVSLEVVVTNTGETDGTWTGTLEATATRGPEPTESTQWEESEVTLEVPAGETRTHEGDEVTITEPLVVYYRLNDGDLQSFTVPTSETPVIDTVNLVSDWTSFGDVLDNSISSDTIGDLIDIGTRFWYWVENQSVEVYYQVEIHDESGDRVGINTDTQEQVTSTNGWQEYESVLSFDTSGWDEGTYTAYVFVRDEQNSEVSNQGSVEFELI
jgi:hypothetical protein